MITRMIKLLALALMAVCAAMAAELPTRRYLNLEAIKKMVAASEAEMQKRNVKVTICIVDDSGDLLFLQKGDGVTRNTVSFAQKKARYAAIYGRPSKRGQDALKAGDMLTLTAPDGFPNQGGLPIQVDGQTIGAIACSGAPSEVDEAIAQAGIDALLK